MSKILLPFPSEFNFSIADASIENVATAIDKTVKALDLRWQYRPAVLTGVGFAKENVWSRSARRNKRRELVAAADRNEQKATDESSEDEKEPALGFKVCIREVKDGGIEVLIRWLSGHESMMFESFCGMIRRQVLESLPDQIDR